MKFFSLNRQVRVFIVLIFICKMTSSRNTWKCHGSEIFDKGAMRIKLCEEVMKMVLAKILELLPEWRYLLIRWQL